MGMQTDTNTTDPNTIISNMRGFRAPKELTGVQARVLAAIRNSIDAGNGVPKPSALVKELGLANSSSVAHACTGLREKGRITMTGMAVNTVKIVEE